MSFATKLQSTRSELVWIVKGTEQKRGAYWHYIFVDKQKLPMLKVISKRQEIEIKDYGRILYSGWGEEPPEDIKQKIKEQFGG